MKKDEFLKRYESLLDSPTDFMACLSEPAPRSFRVNTLKSSSREVVEKFESYGFQLKALPFYSNGFECGGEFTSTLEFFQGKVYAQEVVSMLPPLLFRESFEKEKAVSVLDACAAPGSKTTMLSAMLENKGVIVANDQDYIRLKALKSNLERAGCANVLMTNHDLRRMKTPDFDFILLDAPCSSEGTIRKNWKALETWTLKRVFNASRLQKELIENAFTRLKVGGSMVYSTCTFAPEENEEVVQHLVSKHEGRLELEPISFEGFKTSPGVREWQGKQFDSEIVEKVARVWPHHNDTGGFFLAKIRRLE